MLWANVIHNDVLLAIVAVPPLVAQFGVVVRIVSPCFPALSDAGGAIDPYTSLSSSVHEVLKVGLVYLLQV